MGCPLIGSKEVLRVEFRFEPKERLQFLVYGAALERHHGEKRRLRPPELVIGSGASKQLMDAYEEVLCGFER